MKAKGIEIDATRPDIRYVVSSPILSARNPTPKSIMELREKLIVIIIQFTKARCFVSNS